MIVVWTATAEITYEAEQDYILKKWNINEVINFVELVDSTINKLQDFPSLGKVINGDRHFIMSKQTTLIYRIINDNKIELLLFWNNKWNPNDLIGIL